MLTREGRTDDRAPVFVASADSDMHARLMALLHRVGAPTSALAGRARIVLYDAADGAELLGAAQACPGAVLIVVSAHEDVALTAMEIGAVDFLLKPVSAMRLEQALERAQARLAAEDALARVQDLESVVADLRARLRGAGAQAEEQGAWVRSNGVLVRLRTSDIVWAQSEDDYVRLHTQRRSFLMRGSLRAVAERLGENYVLVRRNVLVRRDAVIGIRRLGCGGVDVELISGDRVRAGRIYARQIADRAASAARDWAKADGPQALT